MEAARLSHRSFDIALAGCGLGVLHFHAGTLPAAVADLERSFVASMIEGAQSI